MFCFRSLVNPGDGRDFMEIFCCRFYVRLHEFVLHILTRKRFKSRYHA